MRKILEKMETDKEEYIKDLEQLIKKQLK